MGFGLRLHCRSQSRIDIRILAFGSYLLAPAACYPASAHWRQTLSQPCYRSVDIKSAEQCLILCLTLCLTQALGVDCTVTADPAHLPAVDFTIVTRQSR